MRRCRLSLIAAAHDHYRWGNVVLTFITALWWLSMFYVLSVQNKEYTYIYIYIYSLPASSIHCSSCRCAIGTSVLFTHCVPVAVSFIGNSIDNFQPLVSVSAEPLYPAIWQYLTSSISFYDTSVKKVKGDRCECRCDSNEENNAERKHEKALFDHLTKANNLYYSKVAKKVSALQWQS